MDYYTKVRAKLKNESTCVDDDDKGDQPRTSTSIDSGEPSTFLSPTSTLGPPEQKVLRVSFKDFEPSTLRPPGQRVSRVSFADTEAPPHRSILRTCIQPLCALRPPEPPEPQAKALGSPQRVSELAPGKGRSEDGPQTVQPPWAKREQLPDNQSVQPTVGDMELESVYGSSVDPQSTSSVQSVQDSWETTLI
jgi:hypothetical protein